MLRNYEKTVSGIGPRRPSRNGSSVLWLYSRSWARAACRLTALMVASVVSVASVSTARLAAQEVFDEPASLEGMGVEELLSLADGKRKAGDARAALDILRQASRSVKASKGDRHPDNLAILDRASAILVELGRLSDAAGPIGKAVAIREALRAEQPESRSVAVDLARSLVDAANVAAETGKPADAREKLSRADDALASAKDNDGPAVADDFGDGTDSQEAGGPDPDAAARVRLDAAMVRERLGEDREAMSSLESLAAECRKRLGPAHATTARVLGSLGWIEWQLGKQDQGIARQEKAIEQLGAAVGFDAPELVRPLRALGAACLSADDYSDADTHLRRAATITARNKSARASEVAIDRLHLARLYTLRGRSREAASMQSAAVKSLESLAEGRDFRAATALRQAGDLFFAAGGTERAEKMFALALSLDEEARGSNAIAVSADRLGLGRCLMAKGNPAAAREMFDTAAAIVSLQREGTHPAVIEVVREQAACALAEGRLDDLAPLMKSLLATGLPFRDRADDERLAELFDAAAAIEEASGSPERGRETRETLLRLRERQFGAGHARVADLCTSYAVARQAVKAWKDAVAFHERARSLREKEVGDDHPDIAAILLPLAQCQRAMERNDAAEESLERALAIWDRAVGREHAVSVATVRTLALVRLSLDKKREAVPLMERLLAAYDRQPDVDQRDVLKLLRKLAEVNESLGEGEQARRYLDRAEAIGATAAGNPES